MQYFLSKQFEKKFSKLSKKNKNKAVVQFGIFIIDPMDMRLNNHSLSGKWSEHRSINVTGDIRAIYILVDDDIARFVDIGSHSELYS